MSYYEAFLLDTLYLSCALKYPKLTTIRSFSLRSFYVKTRRNRFLLTKTGSISATEEEKKTPFIPGHQLENTYLNTKKLICIKRANTQLSPFHSCQTPSSLYRRHTQPNTSFGLLSHSSSPHPKSHF